MLCFVVGNQSFFQWKWTIVQNPWVRAEDQPRPFSHLYCLLSQYAHIQPRPRPVPYIFNHWQHLHGNNSSSPTISILRVVINFFLPLYHHHKHNTDCIYDGPWAELYVQKNCFAKFNIYFLKSQYKQPNVKKQLLHEKLNFWYFSNLDRVVFICQLFLHHGIFYKLIYNFDLKKVLCTDWLCFPRSASYDERKQNSITF